MVSSLNALCAVLALGSQVAAFPTLEHLAHLSGQTVTEAQLETARSQVEQRDTTWTPIDISGEHAYVAPVKGDVRGPCPGLNVLSNHGYLPHNGVASLAEYPAAVNKVFNMGLDVGTALSAFGTAVAGNLVSLDPGFSMGGKTANSANLLGNVLGLLGQPVGLSGTHGQYEEDASPTRGDLYSDGDNSLMNMNYFMDLYNLQKDSPDPNYGMDVVLEHNINRYTHSLNNNPYFWYGPVGGTIVRNAAYCFLGRLMANYSAEYPVDGRLSKETLKTFFGVSGEEGSFVYNKGNERIPANFYRRPTPYGFIQVVEDITTFAAKYPQILNAGGNTGKVNSFVGIDVENLTGGVLNAQTLLQGNNAMCLALELLIEFSPSLLHSLYTTITTPLKKLTDALNAPIASLNCPQLTTANNGGENILAGFKATYPGAAKAGIAF